VHNNGDAYQFKVGRFLGGFDLLDMIGLPAEDYGWFIDPWNGDMINLMAAFIRHANFVVAVSPGQMADYLRSDEKGGGEGLCHIYRELFAQGRLYAITNGIFLRQMQEKWFGMSLFDVMGAHEPADSREAIAGTSRGRQGAGRSGCSGHRAHAEFLACLRRTDDLWLF
jgi:hypothetical protein